MPIKLTGNTADFTKLSKQIYTPKFFSKDITGTGKTVGLLSQNIFPANIPVDAVDEKASTHWGITTYTDKYYQYKIYPLLPLGPYVPLLVKNAITFDPSWCKLTSDVASIDKYIALIPSYFTLIESLATTDNSATATAASKRAVITYLMPRIDVDRNNNDTVTITDYSYTSNPQRAFLDTSPSNTDCNAFSDYLMNYNPYTEICQLSQLWQTKLEDIIIDAYDKDWTSFPIDSVIRYIAQYKVSLSQYNKLYTSLTSRFPPNVIKQLTRMNTSLLLQDTINHLAQTQFPSLPPMGATNKKLDLSWCSKEQFDAITSREPLNQVQAGAGTGKSTVIKSRIDYLAYLGVDLNKVMVLSFTNAAADNITARCPGIQSMTIAKMIDTIYTTNHPTHQLSPTTSRRGEGSTFTNTLELYKDSMPMVQELIHASKNAERYNDYASLLRLVENNYNDIMTILDTIGQTTFHLEIIICYLEHASIKIPFDIEHLLIDEVQDNAIFEFIFFLNLTHKLKNHLYLVGDCSQTLYEFRASDPRALNAIENSGLFATYPLNINYRSNQNILHFANALLDDIEANQYANIQLQAFHLDTVTKESFSNAVTVDYERLERVSTLKDRIRSKLHSPDVKQWIEAKISNGEQICILAYKRRDVNLIQSILEELYPAYTHTSIIPVKNNAFAYFSRYIYAHHQELNMIPVSDIDALFAKVRAEIIASLTDYNITPQSANYTKIIATVNEMLKEWQANNKGILQDKLALFHANCITKQELIETVGSTLIDYEIQKNALRQSLVSQRNADKKENTANSHFIYSTIHSAKGLEFDNVLLLYQNRNKMDEETKRMYYVALTRAKKSEYVLAFDTVLTALIRTRYDNILAHLPDACSLPTTSISA